MGLRGRHGGHIAGGGGRLGHTHLALEAALAGQGVALVRVILVARDLDAGRLVAPSSSFLESGLADWVVLPGKPPRPAVSRFRA